MKLETTWVCPDCKAENSFIVEKYDVGETSQFNREVKCIVNDGTGCYKKFFITSNVEHILHATLNTIQPVTENKEVA